MRNSRRKCDFVIESNLSCARKLLKLWRCELWRPLDFVVVSRDAVCFFWRRNTVVSLLPIPSSFHLYQNLHLSAMPPQPRRKLSTLPPHIQLMGNPRILRKLLRGRIVLRIARLVYHVGDIHFVFHLRFHFVLLLLFPGCMVCSLPSRFPVQDEQDNGEREDGDAEPDANSCA